MIGFGSEQDIIRIRSGTGCAEVSDQFRSAWVLREGKKDRGDATICQRAPCAYQIEHLGDMIVLLPQSLILRLVSGMAGFKCPGQASLMPLTHQRSAVREHFLPLPSGIDASGPLGVFRIWDFSNVCRRGEGEIGMRIEVITGFRIPEAYSPDRRCFRPFDLDVL